MTLQGYTNTADSVYTRQEMVKTSQGDMQLQRVVLLGRYVMPTESMVIDYLQKEAKSLSGLKGLVLPAGLKAGRTALEKLLVALPDNIFNGINTGDESCLQFIRQNTPASPDGAENREYLQIQSGLLPLAIMGQIDTSKREAYEAVLQHSQIKEMGLGKQWSGQILLYNGDLPPEADMDMLLKHVVRQSRTLSIEGNASPAEVTPLIQSVYNQPSSFLSEVVDLFEEMREQYAIGPVVALHAMIKQAAVQQAQAASSSESRLLVPGNGAGTPLGPGNGRR